MIDDFSIKNLLDAPNSWIYQTWIYVLLMMIVKLLTTIIIQMDVWNSVRKAILSPFKNENMEIIFVMLIIPFFVNVLIFWITDNFLMRNKKHFLGHHQMRPVNTAGNKRRRGKSILEKVRVKYNNKMEHHVPLKKYESESDLISSEDEPIIEIHGGSSSATNVSTTKIQQRSSSILG